MPLQAVVDPVWPQLRGWNRRNPSWSFGGQETMALRLEGPSLLDDHAQKTLRQK